MAAQRPVCVCREARRVGPALLSGGWRRGAILAAWVLLGMGSAWAAADTAALGMVRAKDYPGDAGGSVIVWWPRPEEGATEAEYEVLIASSPAGPFRRAAMVSGRGSLAADLPAVFGHGPETKTQHFAVVSAEPQESGEPRPLADGREYYFRVDLRRGDQVYPGTQIVAAVPAANLFNRAKTNNLVMALVFSGLILGAIRLARTRDLYIRKIAGLEAIDEALGRATEMGRAVLFVHGLRDLSSISTIAAVSILGRVARRTAQYATLLRVANTDPVVMSVSQETVKEAYLEAGRPDAYRADDIFIAGTDQFSYAAAVEGIMLRERPATNIIMGYFYAEALLLTETGASTGAIQIAGTDAFTQLPFFVTTCDYTLMGEELYAASAYLSREPRLLGSLKGQDAGKGILIVIIVAGALLASLGYPQFAHLFAAY